MKALWISLALVLSTMIAIAIIEGGLVGFIVAVIVVAIIVYAIEKTNGGV